MKTVHRVIFAIGACSLGFTDGFVLQRTVIVGGCGKDVQDTAVGWTLAAAGEPDGGDSVEVVAERPDPSVLVSAKDGTSQQLTIGATAGVLFLGTTIFINVLNTIEAVLPNGWFELWRDYTWPVPMGLIFLAAGIGHFALKESFLPMVPPKGTWGGLWQVPAPGSEELGLSYEEYHTYWTGVAEIGGGLMLIAGGFGVLPVQIPSFLLFLLTIAVTPANTYMYTHDIQPPGMPPIPYPEGHYGRAVAQCVLLGIFWKLTFQ